MRIGAKAFSSSSPTVSSGPLMNCSTSARPWRDTTPSIASLACAGSSPVAFPPQTPRLLRRDLIHPQPRRLRTRPHKRQLPLFEDFLKLAALTELAVQHRKDDISGTVEPGEVGRGDIAGKYLVPHRPQSFDHRLAAD